MKIRYCKRCGAPITDSVHAWYCPKCREERRQETMQRGNELKKLKRRLRNNYKYNKNHGLEIEEVKPKPRAGSGMSPASRRWARMSLKELDRECMRYGISYGDSQVMAQNNTLPEDWGLGK